jgi:hypothetical protein
MNGIRRVGIATPGAPLLGSTAMERRLLCVRPPFSRPGGRIQTGVISLMTGLNIKLR